MLRFLISFAVLAGCLLQGAEEFPVQPYTDPSQLDCPWPRMSHYKQPWRGFIETRSGYDFLNGIGVNLHIPGGTEDVAIRLLAESGFKTFRIEIGWGSMTWDETRLNDETGYRRRLELCVKHGIRPTILINAHQGVPCPVKFYSRQLTADAEKGAKMVKLSDTRDLVIGRSGLSGLSDYWAAEALITSINESTGGSWIEQSIAQSTQGWSGLDGYIEVRAPAPCGHA